MDVRVPTYWFWFVVFFGVGCLLPVIPIPLRGGTGYSVAILAFVYTASIEEGGSQLWETVLVVHTTASAVLAVFAGICQHSRDKRRGADRNRVDTTFSIRFLLAGVAVFAMVCGLLRLLEAPPMAFLCVLIAGAGQPCTGFAVGLCQRRAPEPGTVGQTSMRAHVAAEPEPLSVDNLDPLRTANGSQTSVR